VDSCSSPGTRSAASQVERAPKTVLLSGGGACRSRRRSRYRRRDCCPTSGSLPPKEQVLDPSSISRSREAQCAVSVFPSMVNG
jgi:hypothetical protein